MPFVAGQLLRRWIGGFLTRHKKVLGYVDRGSILLVVYTAFSAGMVQGIWHQVSAAAAAGLLGVEAVLLAVMLDRHLVRLEAARLRPGGPDRDHFAGSKKSLAAGLPMASVLFGAHAGLAVLPLMLFHQMQLMVCAVLAKRYARSAAEAAASRRRRRPRRRAAAGEAGGRRRPVWSWAEPGDNGRCEDSRAEPGGVPRRVRGAWPRR